LKPIEKNQESAIRTWGEGITGPVELALLKTKDRRSAQLEEFCDRLGRSAPAVVIREVTGERGDLPAIFVGDSWTIHMAPVGKELEPFLDLLSRAATGDGGLPRELNEMLAAVDVPSLVDMFVSTQCPNCPAVVSRIAPFPLANPLIAVRITDGILFPERAAEKSVRAVPTVFTADGIRFTGQVGAEEVADALLRSDPARLTAEAFARMIQAGDAEGLADMILERGQVFPGVLDLLAGGLFSLRLGAMVAMETVGERNADLARASLVPLWDRMEKADLSARGDIVYLIGEYGDAAWSPRLRELKESATEPELAEAAEDALLRLKERG
jgi:hypothetical protein